LESENEEEEATTARETMVRALWRRSKLMSSLRRDQIAEDVGTSTTIVGAKSLVGRSSWWSLSGERWR
jgi:hypothetical protein